MTHGPDGDIVSLYTTLPWATLCEEVAKLKIGPRKGTLIALPQAANSGGGDGDLLHPLLQTHRVNEKAPFESSSRSSSRPVPCCPRPSRRLVRAYGNGERSAWHRGCLGGASSILHAGSSQSTKRWRVELVARPIISDRRLRACADVGQATSAQAGHITVNFDAPVPHRNCRGRPCGRATHRPRRGNSRRMDERER